MNFNMKTPCKECPFRPDSITHKTLSEGRLEDIVETLRDGGTFQCHKSIPDDVESQHCAGALILLEREDNPSQMMRIAERLRCYDPRALDMDAEIINGDDY
ncbi:hypothetical protein ACQR3P_28825 [Rhodococcus sp. IEGM1300]